MVVTGGHPALQVPPICLVLGPVARSGMMEGNVGTHLPRPEARA